MFHQQLQQNLNQISQICQQLSQSEQSNVSALEQMAQAERRASQQLQQAVQLCNQAVQQMQQIVQQSTIQTAPTQFGTTTVGTGSYGNWSNRPINTSNAFTGGQSGPYGFETSSELQPTGQKAFNTNKDLNQ